MQIPSAFESSCRSSAAPLMLDLILPYRAQLAGRERTLRKHGAISVQLLAHPLPSPASAGT
jgi:hypothetical protein